MNKIKSVKKKDVVIPKLIYVVFSVNNDNSGDTAITAFADKKQAAAYCDHWNSKLKDTNNVTLFFSPLKFQE